MPDMDGIELVDTLKRNGLRIPTIFITAFATVRIRERVQAGATLCMIEKPIDAAELETWFGRAPGYGRRRKRAVENVMRAQVQCNCNPDTFGYVEEKQTTHSALLIPGRHRR